MERRVTITDIVVGADGYADYIVAQDDAGRYLTFVNGSFNGIDPRTVCVGDTGTARFVKGATYALWFWEADDGKHLERGLK